MKATFVVEIDIKEKLTEREGKSAAHAIKGYLKEILEVTGLKEGASYDHKIGFKTKVKYKE